MPVSMFVVKIDSSNSWVSSADQPEGGDDRDDCHQQRNQARDDRAEDEQQDDGGCRQAGFQLAFLQIAHGELVEAEVERRVAGDRHREPGSASARSTTSMTSPASSASVMLTGISVA